MNFSLPNDESRSGRSRQVYLLGLGLVLAIGIFLRLPVGVLEKPNGPLHTLAALHTTPGFTGVGFDENLYRRYVDGLTAGGLTAYPEVVEQYIAVQRTLTGSILPPVRFLYIFSAYIWHQVFGSDSLTALHYVASLFSVLTLLLSTLFALRLRGPTWALGVAALMSFAPTQIHMSQHALVDGFFTFWALLSLWTFWENLRAPRNWYWLVAYVIALCCMALTKENAFFVFVGIVAIIVCNHWLHFGNVTRELLFATFLGPFLGVAILVLLAGGVDVLLATYQLSVTKNYSLPYAILTGDGPWHRYLSDLLLISPIVLILAIGALFNLDRTKKPEIFCSIFIAASYLVMCNIKYGMNVRYANMWDMPLRFLAMTQLTLLSSLARRYRTAFLCGTVGLICLTELRQYVILFVHYPLYELVPDGLLRALRILKSSPAP